MRKEIPYSFSLVGYELLHKETEIRQGWQVNDNETGDLNTEAEGVRTRMVRI